MISLHSGRLLLWFDLASRHWRCRISLGPRPEHLIDADTGAYRLQDASGRAEQIFRDTVARLRPPTEPRRCWDCKQYHPGERRCLLGFPEARQTGGKFGARCDHYVGAYDR